MGVRSTHCKKSEKNSAHFRLKIRATELYTHDPDWVVVFADIALFDKCVTFEDTTNNVGTLKGQ